MKRASTGVLWIGLLVASLMLGACDNNGSGNCIDTTFATVFPGVAGTRVYPQERCGLDFTLAIPSECPAEGCGLIFDVHGFAMDANIQDRNTGLRRIGAAAGFVVAQPTALVAGAGSLPSFSTARDARVIADFAREAIDAFRLDPRRIHIGGFSQGGGITFFSICNFPDLYASAAPIAAGGGSCFAGGPPIPFVQTNGVNDQFANFAGAANNRAQVVAGMGLALADGVVVRSFPGITQTRFQNASGQLYEFIEHDFIGASAGAGHCFPGSFETQLGLVGPGLGTLRFACEDDQLLRIGEAIVEFYVANPKP